MILKIRQVGEQVLRQQARPLSMDEIRERSTQELIESMRETMHDAPGVGLAAPQVGFPIQLVVIEDQAEFIQKLPPEQVAERERKPVPFHVLINPKLTLLGLEIAEFFDEFGVFGSNPILFLESERALTRSCRAAPGARF